MSKYNVYCADGREFLGVHATTPENAKLRVQSWTWGRVSPSDMTVTRG